MGDPANGIRITPRPDPTGGLASARTIETLPTPLEAFARILSLAEPGEPIEVSLVDAVGLVLAEPAVADVDLPPFDRASAEGYAVRSADARAGVLLRVVGLRWADRGVDDALEAGEAIHVSPGDPLPVGADAVIALGAVRPDPETGPVRVIEVIHEVEWEPTSSDAAISSKRGPRLPHRHSIESLDGRPPGLASCVHPVCHRRVESPSWRSATTSSDLPKRRSCIASETR